MDRKMIQTEIDRLGPWYQKIILNKVATSKKRDVEKSWKFINQNFSIEYKDSRILDLGANAGYYSIMMAKEGASVVSIEASERSFHQFNFLRKYFENKWNTKLDIEYIHKDISDINFEELGKFDYIFALAILYHIGNFKYGKGSKESFSEQKRVISQLTTLSDVFLVRARERKRTGKEFYNPDYYNKVFGEFNFIPVKTIYENKQRRSMVLYRRVRSGI